METFFPDHWLIGGLTTALITTTLLLTHHFILGALLIAIIIGGIIGYTRYRNTARQRVNTDELSTSKTTTIVDRLTIMITLLTQGAIFAILIKQQTDAAISSPWPSLPSTIFILFGLSTFLLLILGDPLAHKIHQWLWAVQLFLSFSVSAIVYKLGFGFDPFIHQAAIQHIVTHGDIQLPSILYAGQYALEATISKLTTLSVIPLDTFLIPVATALFAAFVWPQALKLWKRPHASHIIWP